MSGLHDTSIMGCRKEQRHADDAQPSNLVLSVALS